MKTVIMQVDDIPGLLDQRLDEKGLQRNTCSTLRLTGIGVERRGIRNRHQRFLAGSLLTNSLFFDVKPLLRQFDGITR
jgi:hypothetical protein